jgi:hypothetical protein
MRRGARAIQSAWAWHALRLSAVNVISSRAKLLLERRRERRVVEARESAWRAQLRQIAADRLARAMRRRWAQRLARRELHRRQSEREAAQRALRAATTINSRWAEVLSQRRRVRRERCATCALIAR